LREGQSDLVLQLLFQATKNLVTNIAESEEKKAVPLERNGDHTVQQKTSYWGVARRGVVARHNSNCLVLNRNAEVRVYLREVLLFKTVRLCARFSALMLGALGFSGVRLQAHGQQLLAQPKDVSSSASDELPEAPESKEGSASQTAKRRPSMYRSFRWV
jgi:hypothetical protein